MKFEFVDQKERYKARIKVVGVGGAGGNAINNMINSKLRGVDFVAANTDCQDLDRSVTHGTFHSSLLRPAGGDRSTMQLSVSCSISKSNTPDGATQEEWILNFPRFDRHRKIFDEIYETNVKTCDEAFVRFDSADLE